jgi:hypothetical protein
MMIEPCERVNDAHRLTRRHERLEFLHGVGVGAELRPAVVAASLSADFLDVGDELVRLVLGGGWDIASLAPATVRGELGGTQVEMAFW